MDNTEDSESKMEPLGATDLGNLLLKNAPVIVLLLDPDGRIQYFNSFFEKLTGWRLEDARGENWFTTFLPERDRERCRALFQAALWDSPTRGNINPIVCRSGDEREIEWNDQVQRAPDGRLTGVLAIGVDVTERVWAEEALRQTRDQLNASLTAIPDLLFEIDGSGRILNYSASQPELLAMPPEQFVGQRIHDVLPPEARDACLEAIACAARDGAAVGSPYRLTTFGGERWFEPSVGRRNSPAPDGAQFVILARDITSRRQAEEEVRSSRRQMQNVLDSLFAFVGIYSLEGILLDANRAPFDASSVSREEAIGMPFWDLYWWSHSTEAQVQVRIAIGRAALGETVRQDFTVRLHEGLFIQMDITFGPLRDETGRITQIIGSGVDVTARKRAEFEAESARMMLQTVLDSTPDWIFVKDAAHRFLVVNVAFAASQGLTPREMMGRPDTDFWSQEFCNGDPATGLRGFHDDDDDAIAGQIVRNPADLASVADGTTRILDTIKLPLRNVEGEAYGVLAYARDVTDQRRMEASVRATEERYRLLVEHAPVSIYVHDGETILFANRTFARLLGGDLPAEVVGLSLLSIVHPDSHAALKARIVLLREGAAVNPLFEGKIKRFDGTVAHAEVMATACVFEGRPAIQVVLVDVTERRQIQEEIRRNHEALQRSEAQLSEAQRIARIGSWALEFETGELFWSDEIFRIFEIDPLKFGASYDAFLDLVHPDDREKIDVAYTHSVSIRQPYEITHRLRMADGRIKHVQELGETFYADDGTTLRSIGTVQDVTERVLAATAIREAGEAYVRVVSHISDALIVDDLEGRIVFANPRFFELFGLRQDDVRGLTLEDYVAPDWRDRLRERHNRRIRGEEVPTQFEYEGVRRDGTRIWLEVTVAPVVESGRIVGSQSTIRDSTERKLVEMAFQFLSTGVNRLAGDSFYLAMAERLAHLLGVEIGFIGRLVSPENSRLRTIGLSIDGMAAPPEEFELPQTPCELVLGQGAAIFPSDARAMFPASTLLENHNVSGYAGISLVDSDGHLLGVVGVMSRRPLEQVDRLTTLLKLFAVRTSAEIERQKNEEKFENLFESSPDAYLIADESGRITVANRQAEALFGYSREELLGLTVEQLVPEGLQIDPTGQSARLFAALVPRPMSDRGVPLFARARNGSTFRVAISLSPMRTSEGQMVVVAIRDISQQIRAEQERKTLELQLRQAQKLEAIGTLASGIAHDFNNILGVVAGNAELADVYLEPIHRAGDPVREIRAAAERGRELVRQILQFGRRQPGTKTVLALRPVIEQAIASLRKMFPAGIELSAQLDNGMPNVLANATQIHQVVTNLGTNAWQSFEGKPGRIGFELDLVTIDEVTAGSNTTLQPGRYARMTVSDTGQGMDAATLDRIFEPFFTTKEVGGGSGLGLAVVHGIVEEHAGTITIDSRPGEGTTFRVYLPVADVEQPGHLDLGVGLADANVASPPNAPSRCRVLFLDDEAALVSVGASLLELRCYQVTGFTRPAEALAAIRLDPGGFDVIVTDFAMPEFSGLDVAREVLRLRPDLPVVVVSRHIADDVRESLLSAGVRAVLDKPCGAGELAALLHRLTDAPSPTSE